MKREDLLPIWLDIFNETTLIYPEIAKVLENSRMSISNQNVIAANLGVLRERIKVILEKRIDEE